MLNFNDIVNLTIDVMLTVAVQIDFTDDQQLSRETSAHH